MRTVNKWKVNVCLAVFALLVLVAFGIRAEASEGEIKSGIFAGDINLSGMTASEATAAIEAYINELKQVEITLLAADNNQVIITADDLGISWGNPGLVSEAMYIGKTGNVIQRYKTLKDLEHENKIYDIEIRFNIGAINKILAEQCVQYDRDAVDYALTREGGAFRIIEGQVGYKLDIEASIDSVHDYLTTNWDRSPCAIPLNIAIAEAKGGAGELEKVSDVLGTFSTSFSTSSANRSANIKNGSDLIDGATIYPGEEFSTFDAVSPFTVSNGYHMAGSYLNGRLVDSLGGGICQVSTTLYNAVLFAELEVTERHQHSMIVSYVDRSADAAIAESSGKDFRFINSTDYPIYIEGHVENKRITFTIYGHETRDPNRNISFVSEIMETINPTTDIIYQEPSLPIGYITTESAYIGYKSRLWKVVTENGVEVSRTQVNSSNYKMVPKIAHVGTATGDPNAYNEIIAAIGTGSIDHVRNVINILAGQAPPPEEEHPVDPVD